MGTRKYVANPEQEIQPDIYLLDNPRVVVLAVGNDPSYWTSTPVVRLDSPDIAQGLRHPTASEKEKILDCDETMSWLTDQTGRGPNQRRVINSFLGSD